MNTFKCILKPKAPIEEVAFVVSEKDVVARKSLIEYYGMLAGDIIVSGHCGFMTPSVFNSKYDVIK